MSIQGGIFLDRDGTLIADRDYLRDCADVELLAGTAEAIKILRELGYLLFLFSNQSGISRGLLTLADVERCNGEMLKQIGLGQIFANICIAAESPDEVQVYRKPSPRFINEMVNKYGLSRKFCYVVGDKSSDLQAGIDAAIGAAFVRTGKPYSGEVADLVRRGKSLAFDDLLNFAKYLKELHEQTNPFAPARMHFPN
ncbi:MAG: HAD-IIIA family hydrolase [Puniceicoccales bacterium]|jgi:histidinol-phosphate phosphatase family protein|nr:HAD-IIIA family hydrolase [Puniceicoccales bacterium]